MDKHQQNKNDGGISKPEITDEKEKEYRPYQDEIVRKALKENTIICLGTGTGKTCISAKVIKEMQGGIQGTYETNGKRTVFLVTTDPLVKQQEKEVQDVAGLPVARYSSKMSKQRRILIFNENKILVMTAQYLLNMLEDKFIGLENINLLIFDECHHAVKNHPYTMILMFYNICPKEHYPHILGLTASVINEKYKGSEEAITDYIQEKIKHLETTMRSVCVTCDDPTEQFATKPEEIIQTYLGVQDVNEHEDIVTMTNAMIEDLEKAEKKFMDLNKNKAVMIAVDAVKYCKGILVDLGPLCAYEAAKLLIEQIGKHKEGTDQQNEEVFDKCDLVLHQVVSRYESCIAEGDFYHVDKVIPMEPIITKKAYTFLSEVLLTQQIYFKQTFKTGGGAY